jgi:periplasmic copper chaperone A
MFRSLRFLLPLVVAGPLLAACGDEGASEISVSDAWARASVTDTGAAYVTIANKGNADDALLEARSPIAAKVEVHDMTMEGMVMKMRKLDALRVNAGDEVVLAPGGKHIMLIGLKQVLEEGMSVPVTLVFEKAGEIEVNAPVRPASGMSH